MIVRSTHSPFLLHVMHQLRGILLAKNVFAATGPLLLTRVYYKSDQHFNVSGSYDCFIFIIVIIIIIFVLHQTEEVVCSARRSGVLSYSLAPL